MADYVRNMQEYDGVERIEPENCNHEDQYLKFMHDTRICCIKCGRVFNLKIKRYKNGIVIPYVEEFKKEKEMVKNKTQRRTLLFD